jgi:hypothetical protein
MRVNGVLLARRAAALSKQDARLKLPSMDPRLRELAALSALAAVGCGLAAACQISTSQCLPNPNGNVAKPTSASLTKSKPSKPKPRPNDTESPSAPSFLRIM